LSFAKFCARLFMALPMWKFCLRIPPQRQRPRIAELPLNAVASQDNGRPRRSDRRGKKIIEEHRRIKLAKEYNIH